MREKLIELIVTTDLSLSDSRRMDAENIADHLIAEGAGILPKWIPVTERLPENRDDVLVCRRWWNETRNPQIGWYNDVSQEWQVLESYGYYPCKKVTHWMPLPEPPKGE